MALEVTVHRGSTQIGGSLIEIVHSNGERIIVDAGKALDLPPDVDDQLPETLDTTGNAAILLSHSHQDHWGLIEKLPSHWDLHCGAATLKLMQVAPFAKEPNRAVHTWHSRTDPIEIGAFRITPFLTDHSAADAYMLLIDGDGQRVFYTGDFRRHGRKGVLVDRLLENPPPDIDMLIIEGTNLGQDKPVMNEDALEDLFVERLSTVKGRCFTYWSAQNLDRTVTLYRAARRCGQKLVVDLYTAIVLMEMAEHGKFPQPDPAWENLVVVVTAGLRAHYGEHPKYRDYFSRILKQANGPDRRAISAREIEGTKGIVMLRGGLVKNYESQRVLPSEDDLFIWSAWRGYLENKTDRAHEWCKRHGTPVEFLHTSGHASPAGIRVLKEALTPRFVVPVHGEKWDKADHGLGQILRLTDGERFRIE